jgi:beta-galactosidase
MKKKLMTGLFLLCVAGFVRAQKHSFALSDSAFLLDGKPFQMISAEMHYPRIPREAWRQRMKMARAMGINTIGTYVFWNLHEPRKGKYDFSGNNDIAAFIRTAREEGLWVVLRPSPYVCAEWEFGGYPYWLQKEKGLVVRSREPQYLQAYANYIRQVGKQLAPLLITHGGNIILVQVENEYGSYAEDKAYLDSNRKIFINAGFDGILYTCDPAKDVAKGRLPGLFPAVNGVSQPEEMKAIVRKNNNGKGPFYMAEWYPAWFDWWGEQHHTVPAAQYVEQLDKTLSAGISINMYMFHGGTTRGFMNGANCYDTSWYQPQTSSYDYDAPLDEAGNATDKFMQFRKVIAKHLPSGAVLPEVPAAKKTIVLPAITLSQAAPVFDILPAPKLSATPLTFEDLDQGYGYVLYRTTIPGGQSGLLKIEELRDYGIVFVNGKRQGILDRMRKTDSVFVNVPGGRAASGGAGAGAGTSVGGGDGAGAEAAIGGRATIDILVENMGRINFGPNLLKNKKGITEKVTLNGKELKGWQMFSLPFDKIGGAAFGAAKPAAETPVLRKGIFTLEETGDTYLDMRNWGKGCVWVNGHNLGRYWEIGPQQTLYVPVEWLKQGRNEVVVLELIKPEQNELHSLDRPILNELRTGREPVAGVTP